MFPSFFSFFFWWTVSVGALLSAIVLNSTQNRPDHSAWRVCCFFLSQIRCKRYYSGPTTDMMWYLTHLWSLSTKALTLPSSQIPIAVQFAWAAVLIGGMVRVFLPLASWSLDGLHFLLIDMSSRKSSLPPFQRTWRWSTSISRQTANAPLWLTGSRAGATWDRHCLGSRTKDWIDYLCRLL